jgi:hypothetical protein
MSGAVQQMRRGPPGEEAKPVKRHIADGAVAIHELSAGRILRKTLRRRSQPPRHAAEPIQQQPVARQLRAEWPSLPAGAPAALPSPSHC